MDGTQALLTVAALNLAAAISPGPAFVLITQTASSSTRRDALAAAAGTVLGSLTWAGAALLGMQAVLLKTAGLYRIFQFAGGLYLCFVGFMIWKHAKDPLPELSAALKGSNPFRQALLLGLSNPKVIVFFGTVFAAAFSPETSVSVKWAAMLVVLVIETSWYSSLALLFGASPIRSVYRNAKTSMERVFGTLLVLFGGRLVFGAARGDA